MTNEEKKLKQSKKIPIIEPETSYWFVCPECGSHQEVEREGNDFYRIICEDCNTEFENYNYNDISKE